MKTAARSIVLAAAAAAACRVLAGAPASAQGVKISIRNIQAARDRARRHRLSDRGQQRLPVDEVRDACRRQGRRARSLCQGAIPLSAGPSRQDAPRVAQPTPSADGRFLALIRPFIGPISKDCNGSIVLKNSIFRIDHY